MAAVPALGATARGERSRNAVTPEQIAEVNARRREESLRVIAYYKERDRQREEREAAEGRAANERGQILPRAALIRSARNFRSCLRCLSSPSFHFG
jgi:hypothetical protein